MFSFTGIPISHEHSKFATILLSYKKKTLYSLYIYPSGFFQKTARHSQIPQKWKENALNGLYSKLHPGRPGSPTPHKNENTNTKFIDFENPIIPNAVMTSSLAHFVEDLLAILWGRVHFSRILMKWDFLISNFWNKPWKNVVNSSTSK